MKKLKLIFLLFPLNLCAECNLFIHHKVYGSFGRTCSEPNISYADSISRGEPRVQRGYVAKWYKHKIPDTLCQDLFMNSIEERVDESFCLRFVGLLEYNNKYLFIHRFSDFYNPDKRTKIPIKSTSELKDNLMQIEYFRENYREMK